MPNPMRFELHAASGGYRLHFMDAKNGKVIFWTQVYNDVRDANHAVALAKAYAATAPYVNKTGLRRAG